MRIKDGPRRSGLRAFAAACALIAGAPDLRAQTVPNIALTGPVETIYTVREGCEPIDIPDISPRAFRNAAGETLMFTLHYVNRPLRGPDLSHLKIDCAVALPSRHDPDPARFDDRRYIAGLWTPDGTHVTALVHEEYHAEEHGRCRVQDSIGCWYNTILSVQSKDGGASFDAPRASVIAAAPFRADAEQGRHRGFFNPSNIVTDGRFSYFMSSTTGWKGQPFGVCLFRSADPADPQSWRAFDGRDFTIRYENPYAAATPLAPKPCAIIKPFTFPVGSIVRRRDDGGWLAVWMARKGGDLFPVDGFYVAASSDLKTWSLPRLLLAGPTIHDIPCEPSTLIAYPAMLDEKSQSRLYEDVGGDAWLYYTTVEARNCGTGARALVRRKVTFSASSEKAAP